MYYPNLISYSNQAHCNSCRSTQPVVSIVLFIFLFLVTPYGNDNTTQIDPDVQAMVNSINQKDAEAMLRTLVNFQTRVSTSQGCRNACNWAKDQFLSYGIDSVYLDNYNSSHAPNVIAIIKGTKKVQDSIYITSAHIDDANTQSSSFVPGADDNGSGTISVLYAAKVMSKYDFRNELRFVLFTAEEAGLLGSKDYATKYKFENKKVAGIINSDMLLWYKSGDTDYDIETPAAGQAFANFMVSAAKTYVSFPVKINGYTCSGDHKPLQDNGFNAIRTLTCVRACETSPNYHKSSDTVGQSGASLPQFTKCIQSNVATLGLLAGVVKTSINDIVKANGERGLQISWNNSSLRVTLPSRTTVGDIRIYALNGRLIYTVAIRGNTTKKMEINTNGFADGVYQIKCKGNAGVFSNTFIISR